MAFIGFALATASLLVPAQIRSQPPASHGPLLDRVMQHAPHFSEVSKQIWGFAELGYQEQKSSALLQQELKSAGFRIQAPIAGQPTAFLAEYGQGRPVIAILAEFDALPGLSQAASPDRAPLVADAPGHGCGHNLLGSGAALAAVAVKEHMEANRVTGTLRVYGTPAEEGGHGKVYMVRDGLFRDVDVVLHWHPSDHNSVTNGGTLAVNSARFLFHGKTSHAALAPEQGRSALDAVMLMGQGVEFLREHIPSNSRVHYVISNGGAAPNIVPDTAELYLYARHPSSAELTGIWDRLLKISQGATLMTETTLDIREVGGDASILPNDVLAKAAQRNLEEVGGYRYTPEEQRFAEALKKSLPPGSAGPLDLPGTVEPLRAADPNRPGASTDVGDVSWNVPTIGFDASTFVPGVGAHTWQATASSGMSIGQKGMVVAAKALAVTAADLLSNPQLVADAKAEFQKQLKGTAYKSVVPSGQTPPLDYRRP